jgi:uncharacterized protein (DUF2235 family)
MAKTIVILFDGTSNEITADRSNILRLYGCLRRTENQLAYYDPGVGTFGADNAWSKLWRKTVEVWGLATGWGLDQNVKEAYRFLVENYRPGARDKSGKRLEEDDRIFIFGFSRGAYTAHVLAGFIHALGIVKPYQLNLVDYAYRTYKAISDSETTAVTEISAEQEKGGEAPPPSAFATMRLYERTLKPYRPAIKCLGLFDTVASVIEMGKYFPRLKTHPFTDRNRSVEYVRHALAIDERRTMFNPQPWPAGEPYWGGPFKPRDEKKVHLQNVEEVWFAGVHADIGGGYPEAESGLAKLPLLWMIEETKPLGLDYATRTVNELVRGKRGKYIEPNPLAARHNSMRRLWPAVEFFPRRMPKTSWRGGPSLFGWYFPWFDRRRIEDGATLHTSVIERMNGVPVDGPYMPPNLPETYRTAPPSLPKKKMPAPSLDIASVKPKQAKARSTAKAQEPPGQT